MGGQPKTPIVPSIDYVRDGDIDQVYAPSSKPRGYVRDGKIPLSTFRLLLLSLLSGGFLTVIRQLIIFMGCCPRVGNFVDLRFQPERTYLMYVEIRPLPW